MKTYKTRYDVRYLYLFLAGLYFIFMVATFMSSVASFSNDRIFVDAENINDFYLNYFREHESLDRLQYNNDLFLSASERAFNLYTGKATRSHDGAMETIRKYYGLYSRAGENLAFDFDNEISVIEGWRNSPTHLNVLRGDYCQYGFAHYGNVYVLHVACK